MKPLVLLVRPALILNHQQKAACLLVLHNMLSNGDNYDSTISNEVMVDNDDIITSSSSDFEFQSDLGEEIWDGTDDDNDAVNVDMNQVDDHVENEKVLLGISLFLYFFQLTYHISERAMAILATPFCKTAFDICYGFNRRQYHFKFSFKHYP